jgi:hypothetical protein
MAGPSPAGIIFDSPVPYWNGVLQEDIETDSWFALAASTSTGDRLKDTVRVRDIATMSRTPPRPAAPRQRARVSAAVGMGRVDR